MSVTFTELHAMMAARKAPQATASEFQTVLATLKREAIIFEAGAQKTLEILAKTQGRTWPSVTHARVALYASGYVTGNDNTKHAIKKIATADDAVVALCALTNADLRVYEMDLDTVATLPLEEVDAAHAVSYGLMAVDDKVDFLIVDVLTETIDKICAAWRENMKTQNVLAALQNAGAGHDLFAAFGAVLAAHMAGIAVMTGPTLAPAMNDALTKVWPAESLTILPCLPDVTGNDTVRALLTLQRLQGLLALGPQQASKKNLTTIASAA